jgi:hypothetical protein
MAAKKTKSKTKPAKRATPATSATANKSTPRLPTAVIAEQLRRLNGNVAASAQNLGMNRSSLFRRIAKEPALGEILADSREAIVDAAENALYVAVTKREGWAVCFTLKTLGKSRGYVERQETEQSGKIEIIVKREARIGTTETN